MASLGLVKGGSHAGQGGQSKQVTMQDQATSPIMIEDEDKDDNDNDDERTPDVSNPPPMYKPMMTLETDHLNTTKANQEEISCWYNYAKGCEDRVKAIRESDSRLNGQQAMTQVYNEVKAHLPDITMANLRKKTQKARVIYKLFVNIGVEKIKRIKTYNADALSRLTDTQINSIIASFSE
ncbi:hypothetical protein C1646_683403 [Rhizophagus diaphanus]|nr:hypothetical protein C1646_683403 [Rhizophagus diaphanus] [Rhizophagus sp. MUCL 43196]